MRSHRRRFVLASVLAGVLAAGTFATVARADESDVRLPVPSPTAMEGPPPATVAHGADASWHNSQVTVTFTATSSVSVVADTFVQVDGGAVEATARVVLKAPSSHTNDGEHGVTFWSVDADGRTETPRTVTVKIDTQPPVIGGLHVSPGALHRVQPFRVSYTLADLSGGARLSYRVLDQDGYLARRARGIAIDVGARSLDIPDRYASGRTFVPGLFRVTLTFTDQAGNQTVTSLLLVRDYHPVRAQITYSVKGAGRRLALTFDDGGSASSWARILDTLKAYHMHATFFIIGPFVRAEPRVARRAVREGNGIGSHGWTHSPMTTQSSGQIRHELVASEAPWWRAARATPVGWMRPPYGDHNASTVAAAGSVGFRHVVLWDVDPGDWRGYGASKIAANTLSHVHSGAIVGLHVRPATAAALPAILRGLRARGFTSVSLPELFHAAGRR